MKTSAKQFFQSAIAISKKRFFQITFGIGFLFFAAGAGILYYFLYPQMRSELFVPLHYNIHFGVDLIGQWWQLFTSPFIAAVILLVNWIIAVYFFKKEPVLSSFFAVVAAICAALLFVATIFIVLLNLTYYG